MALGGEVRAPRSATARVNRSAKTRWRAQLVASPLEADVARRHPPVSSSPHATAVANSLPEIGHRVHFSLSDFSRSVVELWRSILATFGARTTAREDSFGTRMAGQSYIFRKKGSGTRLIIERMRN
jgi:hypothetical protein